MSAPVSKTALRKARQAGAPVAAVKRPVAPSDKPLPPVADIQATAQYIRDGRADLPFEEGIMAQKRLFYFKGRKLIERLVKGKLQNKAVESYIDSDDDAHRVAEAMLTRGLIRRAERLKLTELDDVRRLRFHAEQNSFVEESVYVWMIDATPGHTVVWTLLLILFGFVACLVKVWPLWMRIAIYWLSLAMLVTINSLLIVRVLLFSVLWVVGFKGVWILPNLFNDNVPILETFTPLIGIVRPRKKDKKKEKEKEEGDKKAEEKKEDKSGEGKETKEAATTASGEGKEKEKGKREREGGDVEEIRGCFEFGWGNIVVIVIIGFLVCHQCGVFSPENIPNFIATQNDLKRYSHILAAPGDATNMPTPEATGPTETGEGESVPPPNNEPPSYSSVEEDVHAESASAGSRHAESEHNRAADAGDDVHL